MATPKFLLLAALVLAAATAGMAQSYGSSPGSYGYGYGYGGYGGSVGGYGDPYGQQLNISAWNPLVGPNGGDPCQ